MVALLASSPLDPLYSVIGWLLAFFYLPLHSLGLATILLTIVVMAVQFPLIAKQTRSMIQMQRVQPEIKKLQQKYKDDKAKQNEELLKFYQENKINPLAGCLPIIVTLPIGIAVFRTFSQGVQRHIPRTGTFNKLYVDLCGSATTPVKQCTADIAKHTPRPFYFLGMNLNWSAHEVQSKLQGEYLQWIPYFLLIALVIFTGWYQVRQTQARQLRQGGTPPNAQMQTITKIMPLFFGVITYGLNAATTIYFLVSNTWRIGQQHFVLNKFYEEDHKPKPGPSPPEDKAPPEQAPPGPSGNGGGSARPPSGQPGRAKATGNGAGGTPNRPPASAARRKKKRKR